jgi:hypothetical protein
MLSQDSNHGGGLGIRSPGGSSFIGSMDSLSVGHRSSDSSSLLDVGSNNLQCKEIINNN